MYVIGPRVALTNYIAALECNPWQAHAGARSYRRPSAIGNGWNQLYTPEERRRRDATVWTRVQAVLAPFQFLVFLISLGLVVIFLTTGAAEAAATWSIVFKTLVLYAIMVTGAIWERTIFGCYLFAPAFFWEDVASILVLALHTAYLVALASGQVEVQTLMMIGLAAYASYVINAAQFILKFRKGRSDRRRRFEAGPQFGGCPE